MLIKDVTVYNTSAFLYKNLTLEKVHWLLNLKEGMNMHTFAFDRKSIKGNISLTIRY
jgi:hypothetical protein